MYYDAGERLRLRQAGLCAHSVSDSVYSTQCCNQDILSLHWWKPFMVRQIDPIHFCIPANPALRVLWLAEMGLNLSLCKHENVMPVQMYCATWYVSLSLFIWQIFVPSFFFFFKPQQHQLCIICVWYKPALLVELSKFLVLIIKNKFEIMTLWFASFLCPDYRG